jgi:hypothetical protein
MAELADAPDSKSGSRKRVGVRPSLWAPTVIACRWISNLSRMSSSVDMSKRVTYSPCLKSDEEVSMLMIVGQTVVLCRCESFSFFNLTMEATHA